MIKRSEHAHRQAMMSEQAVRELKALLDLYWSLCGSWVVQPDAELRHRMLNTRAHTIALVERLMPVPRETYEGEELPDQSTAVH